MESQANTPTALTLNHCPEADQYEALGGWYKQHIAVTNGGTLLGPRSYNPVPLRKGGVMKHLFASLLCGALAVTMSAAQEPSPAVHAGQAATQPATAHSATTSQARGFFKVELTKSLDSKKLKAGDEVEAKLTAGIVTTDGASIPSGTKVIGHVTEAKARSNHDSESTLGIVFDKIVRRGGEGTAIKSVIQAAAPNPNAGSQSANANSVSYGGLEEATAKGALPRLGGGGTPILNEESRGVLGIKNLQLGSNGVFVSSGKEVRLDSGVQLLLDVTM